MIFFLLQITFLFYFLFLSSCNYCILSFILFQFYLFFYIFYFIYIFNSLIYFTTFTKDVEYLIFHKYFYFLELFLGDPFLFLISVLKEGLGLAFSRAQNQPTMDPPRLPHKSSLFILSFLVEKLFSPFQQRALLGHRDPSFSKLAKSILPPSKSNFEAPWFFLHVFTIWVCYYG